MKKSEKKGVGDNKQTISAATAEATAGKRKLASKEKTVKVTSMADKATEPEAKVEETPQKSRATTTRSKAKSNAKKQREEANYVGIMKKKASSWINPLEIVVDFDDKSLHSNPRIDYGTRGTADKPGEWDLFKRDIKERNLQQNIKVYLGQDGKYYLSHGFRRMKAVLELLSEGHPIKAVPVDIVPKNEVQSLEDHFILNNGKPLNDIEQAEALRRYSLLTGEENVTVIADKLKIHYVKAINLLNFINDAHPKVIKAVIDGEMNFSVAKSLVNTAATQPEQVKLLDEGRADMIKNGKTKIRIANMHKVSEQYLPWHKKIFSILTDASTAKQLDTEFVKRMLNFLTEAKDGKPEADLEELLAPVHEMAQAS